MHVPFWQTMLVPHEVPFALLPVSVHTEAPLVQTVAAVLHGFVVVQAAPAMQGTHVPLLHTMFVPQAMPFACAVPVSMHVSAPAAVQIICPTWPMFVGRQAPLTPHPPVPPLPPRPVVPPVEPPVPPTLPPVPPRPVVPAVEPPVPPTLPPVPPTLPRVPPQQQPGAA